MEVISNPTHFLSPCSRFQFPRSFPLSNWRFHFSHNASSFALSSRPILSLGKPVSTTTGASLTGTGADVADPMFEARKMADNLSLKGTSLFLLGSKSPMKSTLGRLLADVFGYVFIDSDDVVEQAFGGASAAKSLRESGDEGLRETETEVLRQLSGMGRLVVCAGDGAVQSSTNLVLLRDGISLWIDIPLSFTTIGKPTDSDLESVSAYEELRGGYGTADTTISMQGLATKLNYDSLDSVTAEDMLVEAVKSIGKLTRVKKMMEAAATPF